MGQDETNPQEDHPDETQPDLPTAREIVLAVQLDEARERAAELEAAAAKRFRDLDRHTQNELARK